MSLWSSLVHPGYACMDPTKLTQVSLQSLCAPPRPSLRSCDNIVCLRLFACAYASERKNCFRWLSVCMPTCQPCVCVHALPSGRVRFSFHPPACCIVCSFVRLPAHAWVVLLPFYDVINYHLHWRAMVDLRRHLDHLLPMQHMVTWIQLSRISYIQDHRRLVVYEQSIPLLTINHSALITLVSVKSR